MTDWQWKVVLALVRYVLRAKGYDWVDDYEEDENILFEALSGRER